MRHALADPVLDAECFMNDNDLYIEEYDRRISLVEKMSRVDKLELLNEAPDEERFMILHDVAMQLPEEEFNKLFNLVTSDEQKHDLWSRYYGSME